MLTAETRAAKRTVFPILVRIVLLVAAFLYVIIELEHPIRRAVKGVFWPAAMEQMNTADYTRELRAIYAFCLPKKDVPNELTFEAQWSVVHSMEVAEQAQKNSDECNNAIDVFDAKAAAPLARSLKISGTIHKGIGYALWFAFLLMLSRYLFQIIRHIRST